MQDFAEISQAADKIVYSTTLRTTRRRARVGAWHEVVGEMAPERLSIAGMVRPVAGSSDPRDGQVSASFHQQGDRGSAGGLIVPASATGLIVLITAPCAVGSSSGARR
jgi:hypothetical protein